MGQVIISTSFNPGMLAKPGYCTRVRMAAVAEKDVKRAARKGVCVPHVSDEDAYSRAALIDVLRSIDVEEAAVAVEHCLGIGDQLFVCSKPDGEHWYSVTLKTDREICVEKFPDMDAEVEELYQTFLRINSPYEFLPERAQARLGAGTAARMRRLRDVQVDKLMAEVLARPDDAILKRNLVIKLAMDMLRD